VFRFSPIFHRRLLRLLSRRANIKSVNRSPIPSAPRLTAAIVATASLALLAAACGGSSGRPVAQLSSSPSQNRAVSFARCMRSHRVPNWPDPDNNGAFDKSKLTSQELGAGPSQVQAAQTACQHLMPSGRRAPNAAQLQQSKAQGLEVSRCVRAHGVANFPDPGSDGRIPDPATLGINQGSPKFEAANQACGKYRPPYMPSNSAYNAYARTHAG
jgi:hypothetical protein